MIRTEIRLPDDTADFAKSEAKKQGLSFNAYISKVLTELRVFIETNSKWEKRIGKVSKQEVRKSLGRLRKKDLPLQKGDEIL